MNNIERKQLEYLYKRKDRLISSFIETCEEINAQIREVKNGTWRKEMDKNGKN